MASSLELFACDKCPKTFTARGRYNQHCKTHSKPYRCLSCDKGFALRLDLARHTKARHRVGNERFLCNDLACSFKTGRKDSLRKHVRKAHVSYESQVQRSSNTIREEPLEEPENALKRSTLWGVAELGSLEYYRQTIERGADISAKAGDGSTLLHCAARIGQTDILMWLLQNGAIISEQNDMGRTALQEAVEGKQVDAARILLDQGADGRAHDARGRSVLYRAILSGSVQLTQLLIGHLGTDILIEKGTPPLHLAAKLGHISMLKALLLYAELGVNAWDSASQTPLTCAATRGHDEVVDLLLRTQTVKINQGGRFGTPLQCAVRHGHESVVRRILTYDEAEVDPRTIGIAAFSGNIVVFEILLKDNRFHTDYLNKNRRYIIGVPGRTPLQFATQKGHEEIVKRLLSYKEVYIDEKTTHLAAKHGRVAIMKLLFDDKRFNPASVEMRSIDYEMTGCTPLHSAVIFGQLAMVKFLLGYQSVDANAIDSSGRSRLKHNNIDIEAETGDVGGYPERSYKTALELARVNGYTEIIDILLAHGAIDYAVEYPAPLPLTNLNGTGGASSNKDPESEHIETPDLNPNLILEEDLEMDLEMQDDWVDNFLTYDEPEQALNKPDGTSEHISSESGELDNMF